MQFIANELPGVVCMVLDPLIEVLPVIGGVQVPKPQRPGPNDGVMIRVRIKSTSHCSHYAIANALHLCMWQLFFLSVANAREGV